MPDFYAVARSNDRGHGDHRRAGTVNIAARTLVVQVADQPRVAWISFAL